MSDNIDKLREKISTEKHRLKTEDLELREAQQEMHENFLKNQKQTEETEIRLVDEKESEIPLTPPPLLERIGILRRRVV